MTLRTFTIRNGILASCVLAAACATTPENGGDIVSTGGAYRATVPLNDFYDFALVETRGGAISPRTVTVDQAARELAQYDVIFIGEIHRHPGNHLAQMQLFEAIYRNAPNLTLSLEQFERDVQPVLDAFLADEIGEAVLRQQGRAWDNYPTSYRPLVEFAKKRNLPVIAAETPLFMVRCVGEKGPEILDKFPPDQRGWAAAELNLGDGPYKDKYMQFVSGNATHGRDESTDTDADISPAALRSFAAQVTRDDTMAESIHLHLQAQPDRKVVHLNGNFHSESFLGTAERLLISNPDLNIAVINPIAVTDPAAPSFDAADTRTGTYLLLLRPAPQDYKTMEEMRAAIMQEMAEREALNCPI